MDILFVGTRFIGLGDCRIIWCTGSCLNTILKDYGITGLSGAGGICLNTICRIMGLQDYMARDHLLG